MSRGISIHVVIARPLHTARSRYGHGLRLVLLQVSRRSIGYSCIFSFGEATTQNAASTRYAPALLALSPTTTDSVFVTAFTLAYGLFQIVHGPLGDRIGKLRVIGGATLIASAASLGCAFGPTRPALGGALAEFISWRRVFDVMAVVFLVVSVVLFTVDRHTCPPASAVGKVHGNVWRNYAAVLGDRWVRTVVFTAFLEGRLFYGAFAYTGAYL